MHIFYQKDIENNPVLSEEESRHAMRVLRLKAGDIITIYNGEGGIFKGIIQDNKGKKVWVKIIEKSIHENSKSFFLHIAIAPTKNISRFEWFLEKAAEIGIHEITPLLCERSERKVIQAYRLNKILISAIKQAKNPYLPKLNHLTKFSDLVNSNSTKHKYIAHCYHSEMNALQSIYKKGSDAIVLIGPEGDFSESEVHKAMENNYKEINLGGSRLRTETAGLVACHTINLINES